MTFVTTHVQTFVATFAKATAETFAKTTASAGTPQWEARRVAAFACPDERHDERFYSICMNT